MPYGDFNNFPKTPDWNWFNRPYQQLATRPWQPWSRGVSGQGGLGGAIPDPNAGSGLPNEINDIIKRLMSTLQSPAGSGGIMPQPPMNSGSGTAQQYLQEIKGLMAKLGGGLPQLDPAMQQELNARKAAEQRKIEEDFWNRTGTATSAMFGRGMENSGLSKNIAQNLAVDTQRAESDLASNIFNQEMDLRKLLGNTQNQGILSQIGILQQLMQGADQRDLMNAQNAREDYRYGQQNAQSQQDRIMQLLQSLLPLMLRR